MAFLRRNNGGADILTVPALGGTERRLFSTKGDQYPGLSWSPEGKYLAFPQIYSVGSSSSITLFELATSATSILTHPPDEYLDRNPEFSPDGKQVAFIRGTVAGVANDVYVVASTGGQPRRLTFDSRPMTGLAWSASGKDIIYSASRSGSKALWRVPVTGGTPQLVSSAGLIALSPTIPRRGNQLAFQQEVAKDNIMRLAVRGALACPSTRPSPSLRKVGRCVPAFHRMESGSRSSRIAWASWTSGYARATASTACKSHLFAAPQERRAGLPTVRH
jgi:Tol biopolymer transport system component